MELCQEDVQEARAPQVAKTRTQIRHKAQKGRGAAVAEMGVPVDYISRFINKELSEEAGVPVRYSCMGGTCRICDVTINGVVTPACMNKIERNGGDLVIEYREADAAEQYAREALKAERAAKKHTLAAHKAAATPQHTSPVQTAFIHSIASALYDNKMAIKKDEEAAAHLKQKQQALYASMKALKTSDELLFRKVNHFD